MNITWNWSKFVWHKSLCNLFTNWVFILVLKKKFEWYSRKVVYHFEAECTFAGWFFPRIIFVMIFRELRSPIRWILCPPPTPRHHLQTSGRRHGSSLVMAWRVLPPPGWPRSWRGFFAESCHFFFRLGMSVVKCPSLGTSWWGPSPVKRHSRKAPAATSGFWRIIFSVPRLLLDLLRAETRPQGDSRPSSRSSRSGRPLPRVSWIH